MFTMQLTRDDGSEQLLELSLDFESLDSKSKLRAIQLWDGATKEHLAAALIFVGTGLPDEDFPSVAPVLLDAVGGRGDFRVVG